MTHLLTIVIPVYNREKLIMRTLDSVAAQTACREVGIIIVDNNSTDNTSHTVRSWIDANPHLDAVLLNEPVKGAPAARNRGLEAVVTPWVMFFDSDDTMQPEHIAGVLKGIHGNPQAEIIGWDVDQQLPGGRRQTGRFTTRNPMQAHLIHAILSTQRYAVRTSLIRAAGGWDNSVRGWNDYELGVRLLSRNPAMVKISPVRPGVIIHFTPDSITGTAFGTDTEKWEHALDTVADSLASASPELLPWITVYRRAVLAADYAREGERTHASRLLSQAKKQAPVTATLLYLHHRYIHRGAWLPAKILL